MKSEHWRLPLCAVATLLTAPFLGHAGQPITIGDGSICVDGGREAFASGGKASTRRIDLAGVLVDNQATGNRCVPIERCSSNSCQELGKPQTVEVTYEVQGGSQTIGFTFGNSHRDVTLTLSEDLKAFSPDPVLSRRRVHRPNATLKSVRVDKITIPCNGACRVTLVAQPE
jgi:hypothetical protein